MAGRNIYPIDIERAAARVDGVRPRCAVAVRLHAGHSRETFAVAVESNAFDDRAAVRRIARQVAHEVVAEVDVRPRNVVVLRTGPEDAIGQAAPRLRAIARQLIGVALCGLIAVPVCRCWM
jgi:acyl-CoA synthetase (AMP-forming)/AMP-acid ligase II